MKEVFKYGLILAVVCILASGLLAGVNRLTKPLIMNRLQQEKISSLKEVFPQAERFEPVKEDGQVIYYRIYKNNSIIGTAFITSVKGYSSLIETMVGVLNDGTINGIKILQQNETPGLGTRVVEVKGDITVFDALAGKKETASRRPWFQEQFTGKKTDELTGINAITGATISSRAVINSVRKKTEEIRKLTGVNAITGATVPSKTGIDSVRKKPEEIRELTGKEKHGQ